MSKDPLNPLGDESDEEELIRSEFEAIVSGLSLDESAPTTYLDELDRNDHFVPPRPPSQTRAVLRWFKRPFHDDDGVAL